MVSTNKKQWGVCKMKAKKKLIALVASIGILGAAGTAYAAELKSPAEIVAGLTGKTVTEVTTDRAAGETYGKLPSGMTSFLMSREG